MKFNPKLKADIEKYKDHVIVVEGKKDVYALKSLGFKKVYAIHQTSVPIKIRVEQISKIIDKKERVCILTDFDKKGKKLYFLLKPMFQELGVKIDSGLRGILLVSKVSHIEGIYNFYKKIENL